MSLCRSHASGAARALRFLLCSRCAKFRVFPQASDVMWARLRRRLQRSAGAFATQCGRVCACALQAARVCGRLTARRRRRPKAGCRQCGFSDRHPRMLCSLPPTWLLFRQAPPDALEGSVDRGFLGRGLRLGDLGRLATRRKGRAEGRGSGAGKPKGQASPPRRGSSRACFCCSLEFSDRPPPDPWGPSWDLSCCSLAVGSQRRGDRGPTARLPQLL